MLGLKEKWLLALFILFCIGVVASSMLWKSNFYTRAYAPVVQKSLENKRAAEGDDGVQPRPAGFREREIRKRRGDRYSTY